MTTIQDGGSDLERVQTVLGAAARVLAPHAGDSEINRVVSRIVGTMKPEEIRLASAGALSAQVEAELKTQTAKGSAPLNELSATPEQMRLAALTGSFISAGASGPPGARGDGIASASGPTQDGSSDRGSRYGAINLASGSSLQSITSATFGSTPFAAAGINFETFSCLRSADRNLTAQNVLQAAGDARLLGFAPSDKGMMQSLATIEHYDNKPKATVHALHEHGKLEDNDKDALRLLLDREQQATTPKARAEAHRAVQQFWTARRQSSGVKARIEDPQNHAKARKETDHAAKRIEKKVEDAVQHAPHRHVQAKSDWADPAKTQAAKQAAIFKELKAKQAPPKP